MIASSSKEGGTILTEAQKRAAERYKKAGTKRLLIEMYKTTDADIIAKLEAQSNRSGYVKQLIRDDIARSRK
jgi:hypothetical protein